MSLFLLDTDTLSLLQRGHPTVWQRADSHPVVDITVSAISIQEQMQGSLGAIGRARDDDQLEKAYDFLVTRLLPTWAHFRIEDWTV
jgi:tRNA(fMet)-specific endonuclease VapC